MTRRFEDPARAGAVGLDGAGLAGRLAAAAATLVALAGCAAGPERTGSANGMEQAPAQIVGTPLRREYDGTGDDLLTAGLGPEGLRGPPPGFADPLRPTPAELRRRAIHTAYRGLVDVSDAGGFGRLYGARPGERVAGIEILANVRAPDGRTTTTVMLQLPASFDRENPCVVAVASSGSRGIYGALPTAGEWGLRKGCAVVTTDKGTGIGAWDVDRGRGWRIDGTLTEDPDDPLLTFAPPVDPGLADWARTNPHSVLFKHAHSAVNPEAEWGTYLLQAIRVGFDLLNEELGLAGRRRLQPSNTLVIAAGISNGGAVVLRALERDRAGWIDGAIASEPNAIPHGRTAGLTIESGSARFRDAGLALYDYTGLHLLYQPCALLAETDATAPFHALTQQARPRLERWCRDLQEFGLLPTGDLAAAAGAARAKLLEAGILPDGLLLAHFNHALTLWPALVPTYSSAYARRAPSRPPCGVSFAPVDAQGRPRAMTDEEAARLWADGSGIAPTGGVMLVAPDADGERRAVGELNARLAACFAPDRLLDGARRDALGLPDDRDEWLARVRAGQEEIAMSAQVGNRPVVVVHGRADSLIPVNHTSRAYYALNRRTRGERDELVYWELQHGHHFDAFNALPGFAERYVPMQYWMQRAFDAVYARLTRGTPLPPSQVLRSRPRDALATPIGVEHLGTLRADPGADAIRFEGSVLRVPD